MKSMSGKDPMTTSGTSFVRISLVEKLQSNIRESILQNSFPGIQWCVMLEET